MKPQPGKNTDAPGETGRIRNEMLADAAPGCLEEIVAGFEIGPRRTLSDV